MTAEIAVMNKLAVALAADSAVTLKSPGQTKIFRTVNKLFALSKYQPVGIMVHGNSEFMGVPWELIIKTYRERLGARSFGSLKGYLDDFINSVEANGVVNLADEEKRFVLLTIARQFKRAKDAIEAEMKRAFERQGKATDEDVANAVSEVLESQLSPRRQLPLLSSLPADHADKIAVAYGAEIEKLTTEIFGGLPIGADATSKLRDLAISLFTRDSFPLDQSSGIVVAGFGTDDTYPSLEWIEVHGRTLGKLKSRTRDSTKIRPDMEAAIVPFAQRDEVDAFLSGINPKYSAAVRSFLRQLLEEYPETILTTLAGFTDPEKEAFLAKWKRVSADSVAQFSKAMDDFASNQFSDPVLSAVAALPKDELASMAETLVNLTSFKRKVTLDDETVGGPIDVAVVSKGDGFVWIKRKHYFTADLNPHFTTQYFNRRSPEVRDGT